MFDYRLEGARHPLAAARAARSWIDRAGPRLYALEGLKPQLGAHSYVADGAFIIGDVSWASVRAPGTAQWSVATTER
jgi:hypothetical protein